MNFRSGFRLGVLIALIATAVSLCGCVAYEPACFCSNHANGRLRAYNHGWTTERTIEALRRCGVFCQVAGEN
jgi:hypothetical protein